MRNKKSSEHPWKVNFGGIELKVCMTKVRNFVEITPNFPFSEFNFYELYRETFEKTELGRMKKILPLHEMAESLGLVNKSMMPKRGRKSYFTPEGKVALMFLKMKTQKEHYSLRRIKARKKEAEILYIFFGIHTANVVQLAERLIDQQLAEAA